MKKVNLSFFLLFIVLICLYSHNNVRTSAKITNEKDFIVYGDTQTGYSTHDTLVDLFLTYNPDFLIHTGDHVNHGGVESAWDNYDRTTGKIKVPIYSTIGNHDKYTGTYFRDYDEDFSTYRAHVDLPGNERYYSYDWKGIHFVCINTEENFNDETESFEPTGEQMTWLTNDLSNHTNQTVVMFFHRPLYSANPFRINESITIRDALLDPIITYDVDLVFNGHDHYYCRKYRNDTYFVVTGGGGADLYDPDPSMLEQNDVAFKDHHFCYLKLNSTHLSLEAIRINGSIADSFLLELEGLSIDYKEPYESSEGSFMNGFILTMTAFVILVIYYKNLGK